MALNYAALKAELQNDPLGLGYAPHLTSGNDSALADMLNLVRATIAIDRETIPSYEVFDAIVPAEWASLSAQEKQRIQLVLSMGQVYVKGANTRSAFLAAFAAGTTTRANLGALQGRQGSRAEQLFGLGASVSAQDIAQAKAS
jgi:hypothetical protein